MEHGLFVLEGKGVYRLNGDWVEVEAGDFMWLRAFCPQACYAGGPGPFRYLLYKDVNRQVRLTGSGTGWARADGGERADAAGGAAATSEPFDLVVEGERVLVDGEFVAAEVGVRGGVIAAVAPLGAATRPGMAPLGAPGSPTTRCSSRGSSTRTCTSTSRGAPSGRASRRRPGRPRRAASRRSSTCR